MAPCAPSPYPDGRGSVRLFTLPRMAVAPGGEPGARGRGRPHRRLLRLFTLCYAPGVSGVLWTWEEFLPATGEG